MARSWFRLAVILLAVSAPAWAQQGTAELQGRVLDQQGAILPGVALVVDDTNGRFTFSGTAAFNPADPRTYPERLTIRVPNGSNVLQTVHMVGLFLQEDGDVSNASTREFLQNYMSECHGFIARVYTALPRNA